MAIVINYGVKVLTYPNYQVDFQIPNNCNYAVTLNSKVYHITVMLNAGAQKPSNIYMSCSTTMNALDDVLDVYFDVILNGVVSTRPKVRVDNC